MIQFVIRLFRSQQKWQPFFISSYFLHLYPKHKQCGISFFLSSLSPADYRRKRLIKPIPTEWNRAIPWWLTPVLKIRLKSLNQPFTTIPIKPNFPKRRFLIPLLPKIKLSFFLSRITKTTLEKFSLRILDRVFNRLFLKWIPSRIYHCCRRTKARFFAALMILSIMM